MLRVAQKLIKQVDMSRVRGAVIWNTLTVALHNDHWCQWMVIRYSFSWFIDHMLLCANGGSWKLKVTPKVYSELLYNVESGSDWSIRSRLDCYNEMLFVSNYDSMQHFTISLFEFPPWNWNLKQYIQQWRGIHTKYQMNSLASLLPSPLPRMPDW